MPVRLNLDDIARPHAQGWRNWRAGLAGRSVGQTASPWKTHMAPGPDGAPEVMGAYLSPCLAARKRSGRCSGFTAVVMVLGNVENE